MEVEELSSRSGWYSFSNLTGMPLSFPYLHQAIVKVDPYNVLEIVSPKFICMYVCMCVCIREILSICMYVCMYVCRLWVPEEEE